jgi:hypothetical protein
MTPTHTERLLLKPVIASHAEEMFPVLSDPAICQWMDCGAPASVEALRTLYGFHLVQADANWEVDADWAARTAARA